MPKDKVNAVTGAQERDDDSLSRRVTVEIGRCVILGLQKQMPKWDIVDRVLIWKCLCGRQ